MIDPKEQERRRALLRSRTTTPRTTTISTASWPPSPAVPRMIYNGQRFSEPDHIRWAHGYIGMSALPGGFTNLRTIRDREHYTADEVVVEGHLCGTHTGEFQGFAATEREVVLPFVTFYRFDASGLLGVERIVMNLGMLRDRPAPELESGRHSA